VRKVSHGTPEYTHARDVCPFCRPIPEGTAARELPAMRRMSDIRPGFRVNFFSAKTSCTYTMNYLHPEKCLRDHGVCCGLILPVNPVLGDIAAQAAAVRLPGSNLTS
jgi:hypothetical protein